MDARASEVLAALKNTNLSIDAKQTYLAKLKSDIKRENVPDAAIPIIFDALKIALPSPSLATPAFSTLGHVLKRLYLQQDLRAIALQGRSVYPFLLDRLGDHREKMRQSAMQAFADFWAASKTDVESYVLEGALVGRNPKAKEASMLWLSKMTREQGLLFRSYVPSLVVCLEDADVGVRETAKSTVIELFQNAPPKAQSDLKKQLQIHNVRKSIVTSILSSIGASFDDFTPAAPSSQGPSSRSESTRPGSSLSSRRDGGPSAHPPRSASAMSSHSHSDNHHIDNRKERTPSTAEGMPADLVNAEADGENIEPYTVHSQRELDEIFRDMTPHFEGRESEQNWLPREKSVLLLRRITKGNAPLDYSQHYVAGVKSLLDGILKVVNSLRTTVSTAGCILIQEMAQTLGPAIDPWVEILLQNMIKVCSGLKKITSQNGNATVEAIVGNASYTNRIMQHMWFAISDKNIQPRLFVTGWLKIIINTHAVAHKGAMEHNGGVDVLEKCIKKGLADPNPGVREAMRGTYWLFWKFWRERADDIMENLDSKSQKLLEKDSGNPNAGQHGNGDAKSRGAGKAGGKSTPARPTLKETIAAQKRARMQQKAAAAAAAAAGGVGGGATAGGAISASAPSSINGGGTLGSRPESALSNHSSNTRGVHASSSAPVSTAKPTRPVQGQARSQGAVPTSMAGVSYGGSGLSSAPLRPGARNKQQQQQSRPITADLYDQRNERDAARSRSRGSASQSPPTQHDGFVPQQQQQQQHQPQPHQQPSSSSSSLRARPHPVVPTPRKTKSRGDLAGDASSTGQRQQENIPPTVSTEGQEQGHAHRPRRLDIAALKAEGRQAQNAAHQALIAHAGDARSPTVIMSPAPDDDVFMDGVDVQEEAEVVVPPPAPLPPMPHENEDVVMRDRGEEEKALASLQDAANIPLPDSSILSPPAQPQEEPPEKQQVQSPGTPRSPGGSVLMGMREDSASPFRPQSRGQQQLHSKIQSQSRIPVSPRSVLYSPARSARNLRDSPSGLARYNGLDHDGPASPSGPRSEVGFRSGSELSSSDKNRPRPLRSRGHINKQGININLAGGAVASPRSMDASRRLAAVVQDGGDGDEDGKEVQQAGNGNHEEEEKEEERPASPDRMITSPSPKATRDVENVRGESMHATKPSPVRHSSIHQQQTQQLRRRSQQHDSGANGNGGFAQQVQPMMSSNQLQDMMRTPPSPALGSPSRQNRRVSSGINIIVPQEEGQLQGQGMGLALGLSQSPLLKGRSMGPMKSPLRPSPLPLVKDGEKGPSVSVSERRRESLRSMSSSSSASFKYEETEEDRKTRESLKGSAKLKRSLSPSSRDPERAVKMLQSAMRKMSGADGVDFLSFRKLQAMIVYHDDTIFADERFFDEFLTVICGALENPLPSASSSEDYETQRKIAKAQDMKKQYLNTVKVLATVRPVYFSARHVDVMRSLIRVSTFFDERDHIISTIEGCVEKIVERCDLTALLNGCLDIIEEHMAIEENEYQQHHYERDDIETRRAFVSGSGVIARLLAKVNERGQTLDDNMRMRVGKAAGYMACHESIDVRHAAKGVVLPLYENVKSDEVFWELLGRHHQGRNLLTYYIKTSQRGI